MKQGVPFHGIGIVADKAESAVLNLDAIEAAASPLCSRRLLPVLQKIPKGCALQQPSCLSILQDMAALSCERITHRMGVRLLRHSEISPA